MDLNMEALCIDYRNKHWSQYYNQILIQSTGYRTISLAIMVLAVWTLEQPAPETARLIVQ